jgi:hypothetical protein
MSEVREHSPFPQRTDLEDFGGPTFLSDDFQEGALESSIPDIEIVSFPVSYMISIIILNHKNPLDQTLKL